MAKTRKSSTEKNYVYELRTPGVESYGVAISSTFFELHVYASSKKAAESELKSWYPRCEVKFLYLAEEYDL
jgi:hypothetical protein